MHLIAYTGDLMVGGLWTTPATVKLGASASAASATNNQ